MGSTRLISRCLSRERLIPAFDRRLDSIRVLGAEGCWDLRDDRAFAQCNRIDLRGNDGVLRHLRGFLTDSSTCRPMRSRIATESRYIDRGHSFFSTAGGDIAAGKPAGESGKKIQNDMVKKGSVDEEIKDMEILRSLMKYLWLKDNVEFRMRVLLALGLLVGAKVINVQVPFLFKLAVDWLSAITSSHDMMASFNDANSTLLALFVSPAAVLVGYGIARVGASACNELRNAVFSKVALRAIRTVSKKERPKIRDVNAKPLKLAGGSIEFDDIHFGYLTDRKILDGASFVVPAGRSVALIGTSGSGKSTILRLLYRFFDSDSGAIRIDGQDIREVTLDSLRKYIGVVPQDTVLFNDTIYHNIHYGRLSATKEEVFDAARCASIHDTIMKFPENYSTIVGERGLKLSGGEKQRVSLARAFLKAPSILLCDEATSALDSTTEAEILNALKSLARNKTSIFIAHRLTTAMQCDEIIVLENGRVVEQGPHDVLLSRAGRYAELWGQQNYSGGVDTAIKL